MKISAMLLTALLSSGAFDVAYADTCKDVRQQSENVTRKAGTYEKMKDYIDKNYQSCLCRLENYNEFKDEVESITGSPNAANTNGTDINIVGAHCEIVISAVQGGCENIDAIAGLGQLEHYQREDCRWGLKKLNISREYEDIVYTNDFTPSMRNERNKRFQAADDEHAQKRLELDKSNPEYKWECKKISRYVCERRYYFYRRTSSTIQVLLIFNIIMLIIILSNFFISYESSYFYLCF